MASSCMSITILVDNHAREGLVGEHGLSMWIEVDGSHILCTGDMAVAALKEAMGDRVSAGAAGMTLTF
jgi:hypothetical protein